MEGEEFWADWLEDLVRHALKYDSRKNDQLRRGGGQIILGKENKKIIGGDLSTQTKNQNNHKL